MEVSCLAAHCLSQQNAAVQVSVCCRGPQLAAQGGWGGGGVKWCCVSGPTRVAQPGGGEIVMKNDLRGLGRFWKHSCYAHTGVVVQTMRAKRDVAGC